MIPRQRLANQIESGEQSARQEMLRLPYRRDFAPERVRSFAAVRNCSQVEMWANRSARSAVRTLSGGSPTTGAADSVGVERSVTAGWCRASGRDGEQHSRGVRIGDNEEASRDRRAVCSEAEMSQHSSCFRGRSTNHNGVFANRQRIAAVSSIDGFSRRYRSRVGLPQTLAMGTCLREFLRTRPARQLPLPGCWQSQIRTGAAK